VTSCRGGSAGESAGDESMEAGAERGEARGWESVRKGPAVYSDRDGRVLYDYVSDGLSHEIFAGLGAVASADFVDGDGEIVGHGSWVRREGCGGGTGDAETVKLCNGDSKTRLAADAGTSPDACMRAMAPGEGGLLATPRPQSHPGRGGGGGGDGVGGQGEAGKEQTSLVRGVRCSRGEAASAPTHRSAGACAELGHYSRSLWHRTNGLVYDCFAAEADAAGGAACLRGDGATEQQGRSAEWGGWGAVSGHHGDGTSNSWGLDDGRAEVSEASEYLKRVGLAGEDEAGAEGGWGGASGPAGARAPIVYGLEGYGRKADASLGYITRRLKELVAMVERRPSLAAGSDSGSFVR